MDMDTDVARPINYARYREMVAYGTSAIEILKQARYDGYSHAEVEIIVLSVCDNADRNTHYVARALEDPKYFDMAWEGATALEVARQLMEDRVDETNRMRILRNVFMTNGEQYRELYDSIRKQQWAEQNP